MKFIKASERLPEPDKRVIVRWSKYDIRDRIDLTDRDQLEYWIETDDKDYEWLDESPDAEVVAFGEWLHSSCFPRLVNGEKEWKYKKDYYTTAELYKLFKQEKV